MEELFKDMICRHSFAGIAGLILAVSMYVCLLSVGYCQVEVSATCGSLVLRSPTDCDVPPSVIQCNRTPPSPTLTFAVGYAEGLRLKK